jgi:serine/threonine-protein kinase
LKGAELSADESGVRSVVPPGTEDDLTLDGRGDRTPVPGRASQAPLANARYVPHRMLGEGGWATVWEAYDRDLERSVALKFLRDNTDDNVARFRREARIAAAVRHRNLIEIYDVGETETERPFLVTELLRGQDLDRRLCRGPLPPEEVVWIGKQILDALEVLSRAGIVHRDVKPHNIFLHRDEDGKEVAKLMDFGIAIVRDCFAATATLKQRVTTTGALLGTPHYMSPEQLQGDDLDVRSDIYSLGVALYEAACGRTPHDGDTPASLIASILRDPAPPLRRFRPDAPLDLETVLERALARDPDDRYRTTGEMIEALDRVRYDVLVPSAEESAANESSDAASPAEVRGGNKPDASWPSERAVVARSRKVTTRTVAGGGVVVAILSGLASFFSGPGASATPLLTKVAEPTFAAMVAPHGPEELESRARTTKSQLATPPEVDGHDRVQPERAPRADAAALAATNRDRGAERVRNGTASATRSAVDPNGSTSDLRRAAFRAYARGDVRQAEVLYGRIVRMAPSNASAWRGLGMSARACGNRAVADRALRRYLSISPNAADAGAIRAMLASN